MWREGVKWSVKREGKKESGVATTAGQRSEGGEVGTRQGRQGEGGIEGGRGGGRQQGFRV